MADYTKVIADIKAHITTNGQRAITGKVLQDVLVEMTEAAQLGDEELQAVLDTSITPTINALADTKLDKTAFDTQQEENVTHISRLEEGLAALTELVEDNQTDIANLPTDADVERVAQETAARATQDKSTWVQIRPVTVSGGSGTVSIQSNAFYTIGNAVSSLTVNVLATENTQNVLEMVSYGLQFSTASTVGAFAFPGWWIFPTEPTFEPNKTYQITCVNGYALITAW